MESKQVNTKDDLHDAQTTNEKRIISLSRISSISRLALPSSFVRRDRQGASCERNDFQHGDMMRRQSVPGQKKVVIRPRTSIVQTNVTHCELDHSILVPMEGDEEIAEEEAVCKFCFDILKEENILKTECGCRNALIHEECAANQSRVRGNNACDSCGQEVRSFPITLLRGLGSAQRRDTQKSYKGSYMSRLTRKLK